MPQTHTMFVDTEVTRSVRKALLYFGICVHVRSNHESEVANTRHEAMLATTLADLF